MPNLTEESLPEGVDAIERIARLSREDVDALPYGLMIFDHDGVVHLYNRYESELSRRRAEQVVGRNWFRDVAPCTRVSSFEGRFRGFVDRLDRSEILRFEFRFHFLHGAQDVLVTFAHAPEPGRVFVVVARRALHPTGRPVDVTERLSLADDGRVSSGLGSIVPVPRVFWAASFPDVDRDAAAREALDRGASAIGRALLEATEAWAERVHLRALSQLPALLATAVIDEAFTAQGLGRIELDFGGAKQGVLGIAVRVAELPTDVASVFYGAIVREVVRGLTGRRLEVAPFAWHGDILRFAATTPDKTAVLRRWCTEGVPTREIARRAGLEVWS